MVGEAGLLCATRRADPFAMRPPPPQLLVSTLLELPLLFVPRHAFTVCYTPIVHTRRCKARTWFRIERLAIPLSTSISTCKDTCTIKVMSDGSDAAGCHRSVFKESGRDGDQQRSAVTKALAIGSQAAHRHRGSTPNNQHPGEWLPRPSALTLLQLFKASITSMASLVPTSTRRPQNNNTGPLWVGSAST